MYSIAIEAGATTLNVPDTVGYTTPKEFMGLMHHLRRTVRCGFTAVLLTIPSVREYYTAARLRARRGTQCGSPHKNLKFGSRLDF